MYCNNNFYPKFLKSYPSTLTIYLIVCVLQGI